MSYMSVGRRFVAVILDTIILMIIGWVLAIFIGGTSSSGFALEGPGAFLWYLIGAVYYIAMESTMGGTLGKLVLGMRIVKADGSRISWSESIIRNLLRIVDGFAVYLVGAILVWTSPSRQRLGDRVAGTFVVKAGTELQRA